MNAIDWPGSAFATSNMTKFHATPSPQSGESTTILAGLCRNRQRSACAPWSTHAQRQPGNHRYHLSQFGSSAEEVLSAFVPYCQRFGLSPVDGEKIWSSRRDSALPKPQRRSGFVSVARNNGEADG